MKVNMHEAKTHLSSLGEKAWKGEKIIIAKAGKPYLDLVPHRGELIKRKPGNYKNQILIADDFDTTPEELIAAFEGES